MKQAEAQFAFTRTHLAGRLVFYEMAFMSNKNTAPIFLVQADSCSFGKAVLEVIARVAQVDCTPSYTHADKSEEAVGHSSTLHFSRVINAGKIERFLRKDKVCT